MLHSEAKHTGATARDHNVMLSITGILRRATMSVYKWIDLRRSRKSLARLSDAQLRDIGLSRGEALCEAARPFWDK